MSLLLAGSQSKHVALAGFLWLFGCASAEELPAYLGGGGPGGFSPDSGPGAGGFSANAGGTNPFGNGGAVVGNGGVVGAGGRSSAGGSSTSGGATSTSGGATSTSGGATSTSGGASPGGSAGTGGSMTGSGGRSSTGGRAATGGTTATGGASTGGAPACADTDKDGVTDCDEDADGDAWTDKAVFNGLHVSRGNQCSASGNCGENDTFTKVQSCMNNNIDEELDQYAGWDWNNPPDGINSSGYGFKPNWSSSDSSWAAQWEGCVHLASAGPHCFQIAGGTNEGCAAFYFNGNTGNADFQSNTGPKCFNVAAGNYPILFHYTMDNGSSSSMHVQYCDAAGGASCTPSAAIPAKMLRTQCP